MQAVGDLPTQKQAKRADEQTVRIQARNKNKRGKHHGKIPVVDAAGCAATVFHKPGLERAKEQDTYDVADRVSNCDQDHDPAVKDSNKI
jgi:hypothetical protein